MNCPRDVASILLQILEMGILNARALAWSRDAGGCAVQIDHIHNLPHLLADYDPEMLAYYLNTSVPAFCRTIGDNRPTGFEAHWKRLSAFVGEPLAVN